MSRRSERRALGNGYARPEMSGMKNRANGEDEAGSRGEREQQPIRRKEKLRRQGSESQSQRAEGPVAVS